MIFDSTEVVNNLIKKPTLLKCVAIEKAIPAHEFANARLSGKDVQEIERQWMLNSIANALIENKLVKFEAERMDDRTFKVSCFLLAIDPKVNNGKEDKQ